MYLRTTLRSLRREREVLEARRREALRQRHMLVRAQEDLRAAKHAQAIRPVKGALVYTGGFFVECCLVLPGGIVSRLLRCSSAGCYLSWHLFVRLGGSLHG
jgi:hypothetical protein